MPRQLRIAILTHSTNPRGGVVHALALAEALCGLGHEASVHAPDPTGGGFFRPARCPTVSVAAKPAAGTTVELVRARIADYLRHFATPAACDFDLFHAHCGIGGNALATLARRRLIPGFVRTVHHVDAFSDPQLAQWQDRAILDAQALLCVSAGWKGVLASDYGAEATIVGNGIDTDAYAPEPADDDAAVAARFGLGTGPVLLAVGGFEARKNTLGIVAAFAAFRASHPEAQLVVAGGASLLDHADYRARCRDALARAGLAVGPGQAVVETGPVAQAVMPALYRRADALVFPSLSEGFGLCVLEAMASGTPAIVSDCAPFTEYLGPRDALFVDPDDAAAIARAMKATLDPEVRARLIPAGLAIAKTHPWRLCAERHLPAYAACARRRPETSHA
ncbi:MSMEG_0565 family glycosyltransferase [Methylobacterium sp. J-059]|jgi:glycosyltransferase-like protein|uniref:MSMEG_0565 family glycosyltransferase n=1 Tax=Methylobacterium sp. J-059 TaxID=2836643 RepID=UPI001FBA2FD0|nr:MSMEG_0565 family glycosyltransferase [Methylobacterium sp. J-059]MCJ2038635.1 MSMEG_0565 family glycosyltransferase [Methylobacterium sp. J-059]